MYRSALDGGEIPVWKGLYEMMGVLITQNPHSVNVPQIHTCILYAHKITHDNSEHTRTFNNCSQGYAQHFLDITLKICHDFNRPL